ncbi:hypothetical protein N9L68_02095 [bacterium]|nr:hypothetical protein [bacterium]
MNMLTEPPDCRLCHDNMLLISNIVDELTVHMDMNQVKLNMLKISMNQQLKVTVNSKALLSIDLDEGKLETLELTYKLRVPNLECIIKWIFFSPDSSACLVIRAHVLKSSTASS